MSIQSILPYTFKLLNNNNIEFIEKTISEYSQLDERFILEYYNMYQLDGIFIFVSYYKESIFDYELNDFKIVNSAKPVAIHFHINLHSSTLDIWSNKKNAQKLITTLTIIFENKIVLEPYEISFEKAMLSLKTLPNINVGTVKVEDISFDNNIIASCTFNLTTHTTPFTILDKYIKKISKITISINSTDFENNNDSVSFSLYQSGSIVVYKNRNQISSFVLEKIQKLIETSRRI